MSVGKGLGEIAKVASDYINNGMGEKGQYAAVRAAREREAAMDHADAPAKDDAPKTTDPNQAGGNTPGGDQGLTLGDKDTGISV